MFIIFKYKNELKGDKHLRTNGVFIWLVTSDTENAFHESFFQKEKVL
jgi:hypothetical protein